MSASHPTEAMEIAERGTAGLPGTQLARRGRARGHGGELLKKASESAGDILCSQWRSTSSLAYSTRLFKPSMTTDMIGVIANPTDQLLFAEFFELFKTPWEFYGATGSMKSCSVPQKPKSTNMPAKLVLLYAGRELPSDARRRNRDCFRKKQPHLSYKGARIPIYGDSITFRERGSRPASG